MTLIPPSWVLEVRCPGCREWHEHSEGPTLAGIPILACPNAPPGQIFGFAQGAPEYRVRER